MSTATNIPKDGYYSAIVYLDTGGQMRRSVQVIDGKILTIHGNLLLPDACSDFKEMERMHAVELWPEAHAALLEHLEEEVIRMNRVIDSDTWITSACFRLLKEHGVPIGSTELLAAKDRVEAEMADLRTANAALENQVKALKAVTEDPHALWANWQRETVRLPAGIGDIRQAQARVNRLLAAGDPMAAWMRNPRNLGGDPFMADQWDEAKGQP